MCVRFFVFGAGAIMIRIGLDKSVAAVPRIGHSALVRSMDSARRPTGVFMGSNRSPSSMVSANQGVVACALDGDSAHLDLDTSKYYKLNTVGTLVWQSIATPTSVEVLRAIVADAYDVDAETSARDLDALLEALARASLVTITDAQVA